MNRDTVTIIKNPGGWRSSITVNRQKDKRVSVFVYCGIGNYAGTELEPRHVKKLIKLLQDALQ